MGGRLEFKYLVPNDLLHRLRCDLHPYIERDPFWERSATSEYTVRSIYYDSLRLDRYFEKLDGVAMRTKVRIRGYDRPDDSSIVYLELKKRSINFIYKHRAPLRHRDLAAFVAAPDVDKYIIPLSGTSQEAHAARRFLYHYHRYRLQPAVLVVYDREAYVGKFDSSLRLTFDKKLRQATFPSLSMLYDEHGLAGSMRQHFIFEVKFFRGALPAWVLSVIKRYALPRMALSKYAICLESHQRSLASPRAGGKAVLPVSTLA